MTMQWVNRAAAGTRAAPAAAAAAEKEEEEVLHSMHTVCATMETDTAAHIATAR
jgi:hypothetical protein